MNINEALKDFFASINKKILHIMRLYQIGDIKSENPDFWSEWENSKGVYYFIKGDTVLYVGRALNSLGARVKDQALKDYTGSKWNDVVKDDEVKVGIVALKDDDWYWAASLETYLIDRLKPQHNKRSS
jgi:excinuclease UvrABC nuclease subunit